jgi:NAD(P)-dependent dehydrogenase (short-subunit alcohol dehydrogenase family)/uncharacterized OB-fold protein
VTNPLARPRRKNPIRRTRPMQLPPSGRSRVALGITAAAAEGRFELQVCVRCGRTQYPPREACHHCLSDQLEWRVQDGAGELIAQTSLRHSHDLYFKERLPWRLGMVRLDCGPTVIVHLHGDVPPPPTRVRVDARLDRAGMAVLLGFPVQETAHMADDAQLREMTCDPKFRKILVTDGRTVLGQSLAKSLIAAGADRIWLGQAEPWKEPPGLAGVAALPQVTVVPLDVTDARSVAELAAEIGVKVDILINNAEHHRTHGIGSRPGTDVARTEMEVNYFGLLRLAQEFAPVMRARGADGSINAVAWVNVLSVFALSNFPAHGTFSASKAAAYSLSQCLRAEMRPGGIRVLNVFPGPIDDEWNVTLPPPKLSPDALARDIVGALRDGIEDLYPGDVAREWRERLRANAKVLERELALD